MIQFVYLGLCLSLTFGKRSDLDSIMGCRKGYYTLSNESSICKKCSEAKNAELDFCLNATKYIEDEMYDTYHLRVHIPSGAMTVLSGGIFNCQYKGGKCGIISCPDTASALDQLFGGNTIAFDQIGVMGRDFCHYHGCMYSESKHRCSVWSIWAAVICIVIGGIIGISGLTVIICYCCYRDEKEFTSLSHQQLEGYRPQTMTLSTPAQARPQESSQGEMAFLPQPALPPQELQNPPQENPPPAFTLPGFLPLNTRKL